MSISNIEMGVYYSSYTEKKWARENEKEEINLLNGYLMATSNYPHDYSTYTIVYGHNSLKYLSK